MDDRSDVLNPAPRSPEPLETGSEPALARSVLTRLDCPLNSLLPCRASIYTQTRTYPSTYLLFNVYVELLRRNSEHTLIEN